MPSFEKQMKSNYHTLENLLDLEKNQGIQEYLSMLNATLETNYSVWKAAKSLNDRKYNTRLSESSTGAKSEEEKAKTFATHLSKIFKPNPCKITLQRRKTSYCLTTLLPPYWIPLEALLLLKK
jgi:hypothetical protein